MTPLAFVIVLGGAATAFGAADPAPTRTRHVRAVQPRIERLIADGVKRSATFASLVAELERSDVIVYVQTAERLPGFIEGRTALLGGEGPRYLRIDVLEGGSAIEMLALIGHELYHATEVARAPEVRDALTLRALYMRIGKTMDGFRSFDTADAQATGERVRRELS